MIELEAGSPSSRVLVNVDAVRGGRVAQIDVDGHQVLAGDSDAGPMAWGSYPMAPWAGRIRHGRFRFDDVAYQLPINLGDHAIHGTCFTTAWSVVDQGRDYADLTCELEWPFGGVAQQHLQLAADRMLCVLTVMATGRPMPATIGWHPWFAKPIRAELTFGTMYERDADHIPTGRTIEPPPDPPWDDCFIHPVRPLRLYQPGLTITVDSDCDHWVVYDMPAHATCVEPQSGPPDAFNLGSAARLEPGELLQRWMTIAWQPDDGAGPSAHR